MPTAGIPRPTWLARPYLYALLGATTCLLFAVAVTGVLTLFTGDSSWGTWPWSFITDLAAFVTAYLVFIALLLTWRRHRMAP